MGKTNYKKFLCGVMATAVWGLSATCAVAQSMLAPKPTLTERIANGDLSWLNERATEAYPGIVGTLKGSRSWREDSMSPHRRTLPREQCSLPLPTEQRYGDCS